VVVGEQYADGLHVPVGTLPPTAKRARTSVPVPGVLRTLNSPPPRETRSCMPSSPIVSRRSAFVPKK
jgi:hypothetical protein